jgi:uncharacterized protein YndB with AHSA1/START domain
MIPARYGRVINIGSVTSVFGYAGLGPYCASRGGTRQLTMSLADDRGPYGITVNCLAPGWFQTAQNQVLYENKEWVDYLCDRIPLKRPGQPTDLNGAVAILVVVGFLLPSSAHVERDIVINAPPEAIFPMVVNLKENNEWSPWNEQDPDMKQTYTGTDGEVGSKVEWESEHPKVGSGTQEVTAVEPNKRVDTHLGFGDHGTADAYFTFEPGDGGTKVTWGFDSDLGNNPIGRYFGLVMDGMIGPMYEKGLEKIKELAEGGGA